jgi:hypothetical protein
MNGSVVYLARGIVVTSVCLGIAWLLMFSYQVFTQTALTTVLSSIGGPSPVLASWLHSRIDLAAFVCSFAWMFVLSSIISNLIFGKEKRIFIQFLVSLALTVTATVLFDALKGYGLDLSNPKTLLFNSYTQLFSNAFFAVFYLSLPFIFMIAIDLRAMRKRKK